MNYYDFVETQLGRGMYRLPYPMLRGSMEWAGRAGILKDSNFLPELITQTGLAEGKAATRLAAEINANQATVYADLGLLMHGTRRDIERYIANRVSVKNIEIIDTLKGKPFLVISGHFACFYISSFVPGLFDPISIIRRFNSAGRDALIDKLHMLTGRDYEVLGLTDPKIAFKIFSRLKKNRPVAAMVDYFYEDTSLYLAPFMGQEAATPAGIPMIAAKLSIPVVPITVLRKDGNYQVIIDKPLKAKALDDKAQSAFDLVCRINAWLEGCIRQHPEQWTFWPSLPRRWLYAKNIDAMDRA
ncbi:MAG: lysophospholipid acyltransferase family protein [Pseudomonadales bacterium]|nr:lysophospholipid acyltransferase family protein [Pseudomonadales bacterium]